MSEELQIVELASQGASREEIAADLDLEPAAVDYVLKRHGILKEEEIGDDEFNDIRQGLVDLARYSKNEFVKAKVGIFLYERKKGPTNSLKGAPAINIGNLNLLIAASHKKILSALGGKELDANERDGGRPEGNPPEHPTQEETPVRTAAECQTLEENLNSLAGGNLPK
jgi:DNA-binding transcriptional ArsR family regulator